jgi:hypothetical protein
MLVCCASVLDMANTVNLSAALHFDVRRIGGKPVLRISDDADHTVFAETAIYELEPGPDGNVFSFSILPISADLLK